MFAEFKDRSFIEYLKNANVVPNFVNWSENELPILNENNANQIIFYNGSTIRNDIGVLKYVNFTYYDMFINDDYKSFYPFYWLTPFKITDEYGQYLKDRNEYGKLDRYLNKKVLTFRDIRLNVSSNAAWINYGNLVNKHQINYCLDSLDVGLASSVFGRDEFSKKPMKITVKNAIIRGYRQAACVAAFKQNRLPCEKDLEGLEYPDGYYNFDCNDISTVLTHVS